MRLHDKIRKVREFKDLSQENVASQLGISQTAFSRWEKGDVRLTLARLQQVADVLEIDPLNLIDLYESDFYRSMVKAPNPPAEEGLLRLAAPDVSAPERQQYETRIEELKEALNWQRQQNAVLANRLSPNRTQSEAA